jgi:transcription termination factor Rho
MAVLDRSELEASPLADLHAIADQIGLEGFRRLRKADLIDAILGERSPGQDEEEDPGEAAEERPSRLRRRRRRSREAEDAPAGEQEDAPAGDGEAEDEEDEEEERPASRRGRRGRGRARADEGEERAGDSGRIAKGVVEVLGNGSAFLRVEPPEPSDEDVYISAAQVRRCELVSGDEVTGPVRTPRRSERYPSLVRIDTINGASADSVSDGSRYEDLPVTWPSERLELGAGDRTLEAIEWLTPFGLGSRVVICGGRQSGKTETLRRLAGVLRDRDGIDLTLVLAGARPEEIAEWGEGPVEPASVVSFAASPDAQGQALERALDAAKRIAARGGNCVVLVDGLDGVGASSARRALAAARNLREGGSLTLIATASEPLGGETTVIALDPNLATTGREPILDLLASGTVRAELLVGEEGAEAITRARAAAADASA